MIRLITGRKGIDGTEAAITRKAWRFSYDSRNELEKRLSIDNRTPICIYSGGPNEQNYTLLFPVRMVINIEQVTEITLHFGITVICKNIVIF